MFYNTQYTVYGTGGGGSHLSAVVLLLRLDLWQDGGSIVSTRLGEPHTPRPRPPVFGVRVKPDRFETLLTVPCVIFVMWHERFKETDIAWAGRSGDGEA